MSPILAPFFCMKYSILFSFYIVMFLVQGQHKVFKISSPDNISTAGLLFGSEVDMQSHSWSGSACQNVQWNNIADNESANSQIYETVSSTSLNCISTEVPFGQGVPQLFLLCASKMKNDVFTDKIAIAEAPILSPTHSNAGVIDFWINVHNANRIFLVSATFSTNDPNASLPLTIWYTLLLICTHVGKSEGRRSSLPTSMLLYNLSPSCRI